MSEDLTGSIIDQYQITSLLAQGPVARVYRGQQISIDRPVAVKVYSRNLTRRQRDIDRFYEEAAIVARLEHINIVPMYAFGQHDGQAYVVMRYFEGGSLADLIAREAPLAPANAASVLRQVGNALNYAHGYGVAHRNVKASNVLLDSSGATYLSDFALDSLGGTRVVVPEGSPGPSADVYTLGSVAFEMLTGQLPYSADDANSVAERHRNAPVPSVADINASVPVMLSAIVSQAMAKSPDARYASPLSFADSFREAVTVAGLDRAEPFETLPMSTDEDEDSLSTIPVGPEGEPTVVSQSGEKTVPAVQRPQVPPPQPAPPAAVPPAPPAPAMPRRRSSLPLILLGLVAAALVIVGAIGAITGLLGQEDGLDLGALAGQATLTLPPTPNPQTLTPQVPEATQASVPTQEPSQGTPESEAETEAAPGAQELPSEIDNFGVPMVLVPAGTFHMGNNDFPAPDQRPEHEVFIDAFYVDKYEVTNVQLRLCIQDDVCNPDHPSIGAGAPFYFDMRTPVDDYLFANFPVISITWERAVEYCAWRGARLPTEAEWEKAARWDPASGESRDYPWGDAPLPGNDFSLTNFIDSGYETPVAVDRNEFPADVSPVGAVYMAGNVSEWTSDWYDADYYDVSPAENPQGADTGQLRVVRGADYQTTSGGIILTTRDFLNPLQFNQTLGFRCALTPEGN